MEQTTLMNNDEMEYRVGRNEDPFDLVIDKWERIRRFLGSAFSRDDYVLALHAVHVAIPFCREYGSQGNCHKCPIHGLCREEGPAGESLWEGLYRLFQAYAWGGDLLPREPILMYTGRFLEALTEAKNTADASH